MLKNIFIAILILNIFGCVSIQDNQPYGQVSVKKDKELIIGTFVQWNADYAVTAKHIPNVKNSVYISDNYDLQFFKKHSDVYPIWKSPKNGENLKMLGYIKYKKFNPTIINGKDLGLAIAFSQHNYRIVDVTLVSGMSGGPVFNIDNKVVGINIGYTAEKVFIKEKEIIVSVYLPYDVINDEWLKFQSQLK